MQAYYWFAAAALLGVIEIFTLGLTTIWFAVGALIAGLLAYANMGLFVQIGAFLVISLVLLILTRPLALKYLNSKTCKTNVDSLIGEHGVVEEEIHNLKNTGLVNVKGQHWTSRSVKEDMIIPKETKITVVRIEGVKLIVKPALEGGNE